MCFLKLFPICLVAFVVLLPGTARALTVEDLDQRLGACDLVVKNIFSMPDAGIPKDLLNRAHGLAIFPSVTAVSIVIGMRYGSGVVLHRDEKTGAWSKPAFFTIRGGSLGVQLGAQSVDLILLIMNEDGLRGLLEESFTLGADVSVTAGPVGREAAAATNLGFESGILSYSRSKGFFAGIALTGASLEPDRAANEVFHGRTVSVQDIFYEGKGSQSEASAQLLKTVDSNAK